MKFYKGLFCFSIFLAGCGLPEPKIKLNGSVILRKADSNVSRIDLTFPAEPDKHTTTYLLRTSEDVDQAIGHLEGLISDLKYAKEQMKKEEVAKPPTPTKEKEPQKQTK